MKRSPLSSYCTAAACCLGVWSLGASVFLLTTCAATDGLQLSDTPSNGGGGGAGLGGGMVESGGEGGAGAAGGFDAVGGDGTGGGIGGDGGAVGGGGGAGGGIVCSPPASTAAPHYVDPLGNDSIATHGGGPGECALKTIDYALSYATDEVHVSADSYSVMTSPITVTGTQHLLCDSAGGTMLSGQPAFSSWNVTLRLVGDGARASYCDITALNSAGYCVEVVGDDIVLDQLVMTSCGGAAIKVAGDEAIITNNTINHIAANVFFQSPRSAMISNNEFHANGDDVSCNGLHDDPVGINTITGSGNTHPSASVVCSDNCNCPVGFE